jgi:hypothetical protein
MASSFEVGQTVLEGITNDKWTVIKKARVEQEMKYRLRASDGSEIILTANEVISRFKPLDEDNEDRLANLDKGDPSDILPLIS